MEYEAKREEDEVGLKSELGVIKVKGPVNMSNQRLQISQLWTNEENSWH